MGLPAKMTLPVCHLSLPRLANSIFPLNPCRQAACIKKKNEFASLPRFLSRGGPSASVGPPVAAIGNFGSGFQKSAPRARSARPPTTERLGGRSTWPAGHLGGG